MRKPITFFLLMAIFIAPPILLLAPSPVYAQDPDDDDDEDEPFDPMAPNPDFEFEDELDKYNAYLGRPSLYVRSRAMTRFAATRDPRAFDLLVQRYLDPKESHPDHVGYLIAGVMAEHFTSPDFTAQWQDFLFKTIKPESAWLWYNALGVQVLQEGGVKSCHGLALDEEIPVFLRATAIQAIAESGDADAVVKVISEMLAPPPPGKKKKKGLGYAVVIETCAAALNSARALVGEPEFDQAAELVIKHMDDKEVPFRSKLIIARELKELFRTDKLYINADGWFAVLAGESAEAAAKRNYEKRPEGADDPGRVATVARELTDDPSYTTPEFMGVKAAGTRIAFVIDMSDSMTAPLTDAEKEDLKRPQTGEVNPAPERARPQTGPGADNDPDADEGRLGRKGSPADNEPKKPKVPGIEDLPWDFIETRFDAARECLKLALKGLGKEMYFTVIFFGTKAESLIGNAGLLQASKGNINRVIKELDRVVVGKARKDRPFGTLRGYTNFHGGILEAFRATDGKQITAHEHVDPRGFIDGVDTVFILSDGDPSWDNFVKRDRREKDTITGDPESNTPLPDEDFINYYGPYVETRYPFLIRDIKRMNLFRRTQIHTIGFGESNADLLQQIAELGKGEFRQIGGGG